MVAEGSQRPAGDLETLAQARFPALSQAEVTLLRAAPKGEVAWCGPSAKDDDPANDPAKADQWGHEREIRADLIRWLCVDRDAASTVEPKGIQIHAARITGGLDLSFVSVPFPLSLRRCRFIDDAVLISTGLPELSLAGSRVQSVTADGANVKGGVFLHDGFCAEGEVRLSGAQIGGDLTCSRGTFKNPGKDALSAERADVKGSVFLRDGFSAEGAVRLVNAQIGGDLDCSGGTFKNPDGDALAADRADVKGSLFLRHDFRAEGEVLLLGVQVGSNLDCGRSTFKNPGKNALSADHVNVKGGVFLNDGFRVEGTVRLLGAQIGGILACQHGTFKNPGSDALNADSVDVKGSVFLDDRFSAEGTVRLVGARIGGDLTCGRGTFKNPDGDALAADRADVKGSVFLRDRFSAEGEVRLLGAQIGGDIACDRGSFKNPGKHALSADGADVRGGVFLKDGFSAEGTVRLLGAKIGADLACSGGSFQNPDENALGADRADVKGSVFLRDGFSAEGAVRLHGAQIGGNLDCSGGGFSELKAETAAIAGPLFWRRVMTAKTTTLDLTNASAGSLVDDEESWPGEGKLFLDGFVYGHISGDSLRDAKTRLRWLELQDPFRPQPYRQLARVLREAGDDGGARKVLFEMERRRRQAEDRSWYARLWNWLLKWSIGYGRRPARALGWLALLTALGWVLFWYGYSSGAMAPTDNDAYHFFSAQGRPPGDYPRFTASLYSLENSLSFVNLGQKDHWTPDPSPQGSRRLAGFLRWFRWVQAFLGWVLATLCVAGGVIVVVRKE
jgi:hypothetical protein